MSFPPPPPSPYGDSRLPPLGGPVTFSTRLRLFWLHYGRVLFAAVILISVSLILLAVTHERVVLRPVKGKTVILTGTKGPTDTPTIWTTTPGIPADTPTPQTVTIYRQGTPIVVTTTPGPTPTPVIRYINGTPQPTYTPPPPYPTLTPYATYTPVPTVTPVPTATPRPTFTLVDTLDGSGPEFATSGDLNVNPIGPDATTENRGSWAPDWITWKASNIVGFDITAYYCTGEGDPANCDPNHPNLGILPMAIEESTDNSTWCTPGHTQTDNAVPGHPDWTQVDWTFDSACVGGAQYLRATWEDTDQSYPLWDPALGNATITYQP